MISVERELAARRLRNNQKPTTTVGKSPNAKNGKRNPCDCGLSVSNNLNKVKRKETPTTNEILADENVRRKINHSRASEKMNGHAIVESMSKTLQIKA